MSNKASNPKPKKYDLMERTAEFGEKVIDFVDSLEKNDKNRILSNQLLRSASSIGANYAEADVAESKRDFQHKVAICRKESKESMHWARMLAKANAYKREECASIWKEAQEYVFIFSAIINNSKKGSGSS